MFTFHEEDRVSITGQATSPHVRLVDFRCMVASVTDEHVKVWPLDDNDPQLTSEQQRIGKVWFPLANVESAELLATFA